MDTIEHTNGTEREQHSRAPVRDRATKRLGYSGENLIDCADRCRGR